MLRSTIVRCPRVGLVYNCDGVLQFRKLRGHCRILNQRALRHAGAPESAAPAIAATPAVAAAIAAIPAVAAATARTTFATAIASAPPAASKSASAQPAADKSDATSEPAAT